MIRAAVVYITASNREQALAIGRTLVTERLVACANILDGMTSIYRWDGQLNEDRETVLIAKTRQELTERVVGRVRELHSYECPCVVCWPITAANPEYLAWIGRETDIKRDVVA